MNDPVNDFLMSAGGAPSAKFDQIGRTYKGTILSAEHRQQTDLEGTAKFWDDGKPMMQAVVTLQTDENDPKVDDDDGQRRLFIKGEMQKAVRDAVVASGGAFGVGGYLGVKYVGDGEPKKRGYSATKLYAAEYRPPSLDGSILGVPAEAPAPPAPPVSAGSIL